MNAGCYVSCKFWLKSINCNNNTCSKEPVRLSYSISHFGVSFMLFLCYFGYFYSILVFLLCYFYVIGGIFDGNNFTTIPNVVLCFYVFLFMLFGWHFEVLILAIGVLLIVLLLLRCQSAYLF